MVQQNALTQLAERQRQRRKDTHSLRGGGTGGQVDLPPWQEPLAAPTGFSGHRPWVSSTQTRATDPPHARSTVPPQRQPTSHATMVVMPTTQPMPQYHVQRHERTGMQQQQQDDDGQLVQAHHTSGPQPQLMLRGSEWPQHQKRSIAQHRVQNTARAGVPAAVNLHRPGPQLATQPTTVEQATTTYQPTSVPQQPPITSPTRHITTTTWAAGFRPQPLTHPVTITGLTPAPTWPSPSAGSQPLSQAVPASLQAVHSPPRGGPVSVPAPVKADGSGPSVMHVEVDASMQLVAGLDTPGGGGARPQGQWRAGQHPQAPAGAPGLPHTGVLPSTPAPSEDMMMMSDPEAERRRVRRRHRRRLAALVVDHWKWFARYRLMGVRADRHYRQQLTGAALVGLQANVVAAHASWRLAAVHRARARHLLLASMTQEWRRVAQLLCWLRGVGQQVSGRHQVTVRRQVLQAWALWWRGRVRHRKQELQALYYWTFISLTHCLREWRQRVALRGHKLTLVVKARAHARRCCCDRALKAWLQVVGWRRHKAKQLAAVVVWHRYQLLTGLLRGWSGVVVQVREARSQAVALLQAAGVVWRRHTAAQALNEWQALCQRRKVLASITQHIINTGRRSSLHACLAAWRGWCGRQRELRLAAGVLAPLGRGWRLGRCWQVLVQAVEVAQGRRTAELRRRVQGRAALRTLAVYAHHCQRKRELQGAWDTAVARMWRRAVMRGWRTQARRLRDKALRWQAAGDAHRAHVLHSSLQGWWGRAHHRRDKVNRWQRAVDHQEGRMMHVALRVWAHYHRWCGLKRDVTAWARRGLMSAVLQAWLAHTQHQAAVERSWRAAARHRYLTLVSRGLCALRLAVAHRADKRALWALSSQHHAHSLLLRAVLAWAHTFLPLAAEQRARAARGARHWRMRVLRGAFGGWQAESARLALKHGREHEADAFARQCLLGRTLLRWALGLNEQRERRVLKDQLLTSAARVLGRKRAGRVLAAWHEVHVRHVLKEFQHARAAAHWSAVRQRTVMDAWRAVVSRAQMQAMQAARADHHWAARCMSLAWPAWRQHVERRRAKRRAGQAAQWQADRTRCRHALHALSWYVSYRQRKASDLQAALALHTLLLQREGVAQWLRVGMWRRTHRLEHRAAHQARALAVELAVVEPYARHWRRVTRERAAARLDNALQATMMADRSSAWGTAAAPTTSRAAGPLLPPQQLPNVPPLPPYRQHLMDSHSPAATQGTPWKPTSPGQPRPVPLAAGTPQGSPQQLPVSGSAPAPLPRAHQSPVQQQRPERQAPYALLLPVPLTPPQHATSTGLGLDVAAFSRGPAPAPAAEAPHALGFTPTRRQRAAPRLPAFLTPTGASLASSPQRTAPNQQPTPAHKAVGRSGATSTAGSNLEVAGLTGARVGYGAYGLGPQQQQPAQTAGESAMGLHTTVLQSRQQQQHVAMASHQGHAAIISPLPVQPALPGVVSAADELSGLEAQLQHCRVLKQRVAQLESEAAALAQGQGGGGQGHTFDTATSQLHPRLAATVQFELQAARAALDASRPAVVAAAQRIQQLRGMKP